MRFTYTMNQIKAYLYSHDGQDYANDKWDYGLIKEIFDKHEVDQIRVTEIPKSDKAFVVIPGPQTAGNEELLSNELNKLSRVVLFINGDENARFDVNKIKHSNIEIWIQYPHEKHGKYNKMPIGVPQHLKENLPSYKTKDYDVYFGGQITHQRRKELAGVMPKLKNSLYGPTNGFSQGDKPKDYYSKLASAKIAPCPSGAAVIDTFRFFESIELLTLPIADTIDPKGIQTDFYKKMFGVYVPFKEISNWNEIEKLVPRLLDHYPNNMHQVVCWWIKQKRDLGIKIMRQINA
jgi:hypothetical protein